MGHDTDVLILSKLRVGVRGWGELDRVCPTVIGRGRAIVAMLYVLGVPHQQQHQRVVQSVRGSSMYGSADGAGDVNRILGKQFVEECHEFRWERGPSGR